MGGLDVRISKPRISATIWPYDGGRIELHDEILAVQTNRSLGAPAGTFAITLKSTRDSEGRTWAQRLEPMDYVEIYMGRDAGDVLPPVMRCFVDNSGESSEVQNDHVRRTVVINGRDYGKIMLKRQLVFASEVDPLSSIASQVAVGKKLSELISGYGGLVTPSQMLNQIVAGLLADPIVGARFRNTRVPSLFMHVDVPDSHMIFQPDASSMTGSIWNWLSSLVGDPFNEMFIRDDDDVPRLYWRMAPLKDKWGRIARAGARSVAPGKTEAPVEISLHDIIAPDLRVSDNTAYSYFFTLPGYYSLMASENFFVSIDAPAAGGNIAPYTGTPSGPYGRNPILRRDIFERYGFSPLKVTYPLMPGLLESDARDTNPNAQPAMLQAAINLNAWLHAVYSPSPIFESGTLLLKGNPLIRIGTYLRIKEQQREFYVEGVSHNFAVGNEPSFTTQVTVTRGLWLANSPYRAAAWL